MFDSFAAEPAAHEGLMPRSRPLLQRLAFALTLSAVSLLVTWLLRDVLGGSMYLLFFPAVFASAWFGGLIAGMVVVAVAVLGVNYIFIPPQGVLGIVRVQDLVATILYAAVASGVCWAAAALEKARSAADTARLEQRTLSAHLESVGHQLADRVDEAEHLVDELQKTNDALVESEGRFRLLADSAPVLIWSADSTGQRDYFNKRWLEFTGRTAEQEVGLGWVESVHPDDRDECLGAYHAAFEARRPFTAQYRLRRHDGVYRWIQKSAAPRYTPSGQFAGFIASCIDIDDHITARQQIEDTASQLEELTVEQEQMVEELQARTAEAERARREASDANAAKSRFLAVMSHELRTPLNAIMGYADLLDGQIGGPITDTQARQLARIRGSVLHLRDLIDQILSLSRIEAGREDVNLSRFDVAELTRETIGLIEPQAADKKLELVVRMPMKPLQVHGDEGKVRQVLLNLLSNAVKFTDHGSITVAIEETHDGSVRISVADTGVGIAPGDLERIFEPFTQVDESTTRRAGGTGLGLAVSRQLAQLLGGELTARSEPGCGSTFILSLPRDLPLANPGSNPSVRAGHHTP